MCIRDRYFAGGGGGGGYPTGRGTGGKGGGAGAPFANGTANTGGGGVGGQQPSPEIMGSNGGKGIVIHRLTCSDILKTFASFLVSYPESLHVESMSMGSMWAVYPKVKIVHNVVSENLIYNEYFISRHINW